MKLTETELQVASTTDILLLPFPIFQLLDIQETSKQKD